MKASDLLKRYAAGERNFKHANLRGQSFKNRDLSGADFSDSDIRGTNFSGATLRGVNFLGTQAGLPKQGIMIQRLIGLSVSIASGVMLAITSWWTAILFASPDKSFISVPQDSKEYTIISQLLGFQQFTVLAVITIMFVAIIRQGFTPKALITIAITVGIAGACSVFGGIVIAGTVSIIYSNLIVGLNSGVFVGLGIGIAAMIGGVGAVSGAGAVIGFVASSVANSMTGIVVIAVIGAIGFIGAGAVINRGPPSVAVGLTVIVILLSIYMTRRALAKDEKYDFIRTVAVALMAYRGTSFHNADLTDADFTGARLKSTDLRNANLTHTRWYEAKMLDLVRPGETYLRNEPLRQLLITGEGQNQNFDRQDLRGVNLSEANLKNASFIDADFYQANLEDTDLSEALLVRTKLERANLTRAKLTGSCIHDWSVTRSTSLNEVECKYVFMKYIDGFKRDQMPPKGEFKDAEFIFFVRSILDTLDLYHDRDVNPRAAVIVLKSLADDYHEPLEIVGFETRGNGIIIKLKTSEFANQEQLRQEYYSRYSQTLSLSMTDPMKKLPSYEVLETKVTELVEDVKKRPTKVKYLYNEGFIITGGSPNVNIDRGRNQYINTEGGGIGNIGENRGTAIGNQTNYISNQNLAAAAAEIQQLLDQLSKNYPTSTNKEKMAVVAEAVDQIENNPTLKTKVINALKAGGTEAFKEAVNHPLVNILVASIEGWQDAE